MTETERDNPMGCFYGVLGLIVIGFLIYWGCGGCNKSSHKGYTSPDVLAEEKINSGSFTATMRTTTETIRTNNNTVTNSNSLVVIE